MISSSFKGTFILAITLKLKLFVFLLERRNSWDGHWKVVNDELEEFLQSKTSLHHLIGKMFHVWDGNHRLQA
jgi:hypothetical protein